MKEKAHKKRNLSDVVEEEIALSLKEEHQMKIDRRGSTFSQESKTSIVASTYEESEEEEDTCQIHVHGKKNEEGSSDPVENMLGSPWVRSYPPLVLGTLVNNMIENDVMLTVELYDEVNDEGK